MGLSHVDDEGHARMVDVTGKAPTVREAVAAGEVVMRPETLALIQSRGLPKGDVLAVARVAGIMAAKRTPDLIPMCHPLPLGSVVIDFAFDDERSAVLISGRAKCTGVTGVEMEALTAVSVAALTIYDMCKAADRGMRIGNVRLLSKMGGKSGDVILEEGRKPPASRKDLTGKIVAVCVSDRKGTPKTSVAKALMRANWGIEGDAHAGEWHRQVALLAWESIQKALERGLDVGPGSFAENITTEGLELPSLPIGTRLRVGSAVLEVTQIGKEAHEHDVIHELVGDSVIPREGIFCRVVEGGTVKAGQSITVLTGKGQA